VGVAGYIVYLNGDSVATVTATAYTIADLTAETEYTLAVAAFDAAGNRSAQATITAATTAENLGGGNTPVDTVPPSVPADLAATPAAASIALTWTASTDDVSVAGYVVYLNGDSVSTVTATVYTFADLTAKTQYTLAVAAFDAEGNRSAQATITAATTAAENPSSVSAEAYGLKLYPNPVHTELNVSLAAEIAQVELVSLTGGKVLSHNVHGSTSYVLSLQGVAAGSYVLVVTLRNGDVITQIIVKQ
jgi:chitodextrinase